MGSRGTVEDLLDKEAVHTVILRLARGVDRLDWDGVRACFWDDATDDHGVFRGDPDAFVAWGRESLPSWSAATMHLILNCLIEVDGDVALAETYVLAIHRALADEAGTVKDVFAGARYADRFERRDGEWRIADRLVVHDWGREDAVTSGLAIDPSYTVGRRDKSDPAYVHGRAPRGDETS